MRENSRAIGPVLTSEFLVILAHSALSLFHEGRFFSPIRQKSIGTVSFVCPFVVFLDDECFFRPYLWLNFMSRLSQATVI